MLQEVLEHIVRSIVSFPGDVRIVARNSSRDNSRGEILQIRVNPEDLGKVIGRNGNTINAIRTLINALSDGNSVRVEVFDRFERN